MRRSDIEFIDFYSEIPGIDISMPAKKLQEVIHEHLKKVSAHETAIVSRVTNPEYKKQLLPNTINKTIQEEQEKLNILGNRRKVLNQALKTFETAESKQKYDTQYEQMKKEKGVEGWENARQTMRTFLNLQMDFTTYVSKYPKIQDIQEYKILEYMLVAALQLIRNGTYSDLADVKKDLKIGFMNLRDALKGQRKLFPDAPKAMPEDDVVSQLNEIIKGHFATIRENRSEQNKLRDEAAKLMRADEKSLQHSHSKLKL